MATATETTRVSSLGTHSQQTSKLHKGRIAGKVITYLLLTISGLIFAFPLFWTASSSLQTWQELRSYSPHLFPSDPQWGNYADVFQAVPFARWLLNSFLIVAITIPGTILTATLTAYAFARFNFIGKNVWFVLMLSTMMIPATVTLIPQYLLWFKLKMINTYVPLTIGAWLGGGAFMVFLLRQFILSLPRELDEAAEIDGANPVRVLFSIIMPLMKPALTTVAILQFLGDWNAFFGPFIYLNRQPLYTAAVGLRYFQYIPLETNDPRDHLLMASAAIMTIPVLILFAAAQRYFISGVVMSGLKL
uniref:N-Acetyl-D-glucosamine ABC transport system, permease protein 2 n=1 Tax=uncultured bacterium A1Q1_fos_485 TaxID=1256576 RepID=L7W090_9BACT|nr:N-Acetyl-D-glucosamine ABC transport system, permease protein 2 [uncultured bacterium A1Q1_fos_485]